MMFRFSTALALLLSLAHGGLLLRAQDTPVPEPVVPPVPVLAEPAAPAPEIVPPDPVQPSDPPEPVEPPAPRKGKRSREANVKLDINLGPHGAPEFQFGEPMWVQVGETVPSVVVVDSSATIDGRVNEDVVVIGGQARINGTVGGDVVNVGGGVVLGPEAHVEGNVVGVLGGVFLGTNSVVDGDVVGVVGGITKSKGARVGGNVVPVKIANFMGPDGIHMPGWVDATFNQIILKVRPLSFAVTWVWFVAGLFLGLYLLLVLVAPTTVSAVADTLSQRSATAFLMGLLALPLGALITLILVATGIGIFVVPFVWAAAFFAGLVGKAGLLQFFGTALGRLVKQELRPLVAVLIGFVAVSLLYLIPFLGLLFWAVFTMWALGAALLALFSRFRKESAPVVRPLSPATAGVAAFAATTPSPSSGYGPGFGSSPSPNPGPVPVPGSAALGATAPLGTAWSTSTIPSAVPPGDRPGNIAGAAAGGAAAGATLSSVVPEEPAFVPPPFTPPSFAPPVVPDALTLPRVGLKGRLFALVLDWALLGMLMGWLDLDRLRIVLVLGYFIGFWVWRQTTLGGIVMRLKVVRLDGRPVDPATAVVRSLGALFGTIALGLGYFWAGWDPEKQGWHDKIAGTVVVTVPKTQPLV